MYKLGGGSREKGNLRVDQWVCEADCNGLDSVFFRLGDKGTWQSVLVELCETGDSWPGVLGRRGIV